MCNTLCAILLLFPFFSCGSIIWPRHIYWSHSSQNRSIFGSPRLFVFASLLHYFILLYLKCITQDVFFSMLYTILLFFWDGEFGLLLHSRVTQRFVPLHQCGKYLAYLRCCCQRLIALYYVKDVGAGMKYKHEFSWFFFELITSCELQKRSVLLLS